jgi:glycosyltransferase involved in cell wall biosynthesis
MKARRRRVAIGPSIDLHRGIHGSLLAHPPAGYQHVVSDARHHFFGARRARSFTPIGQRHMAECVSLGRGTVAHSSRWAVLGHPRWVVEMDDLGYPLLFGRHGLLASFRASFARPWSASLGADILRRARAMLGAYAHASCRRVVFRTQAALDGAIDVTARLGLQREFAAVLPKCVVIRPAAPALPATAVRAKWRSHGPLCVLFCGRDFHAKQGELALRVVRRLLKGGADLRLTYIGDVPAAARREFADRRIEFAGELPPAQVRARMREAHVLLHTSPAESVGMVFLEAAAAGVAVIGSSSPRLPHLGELLDEGGFITVERTRGSLRTHEHHFARALDALLEDRARARSMGLANHRAARRGRNSLAARNRAWRAVYDAALRSPHTTPLSAKQVAELAGRRVTRISSRRLGELIERHLAAEGSGERTFQL